MPLSTHRSEDGAPPTIAVEGRFDFGLHREFRNAYKSDDGTDAVRAYVIDLRNTEYMDSSALGMLLLLREFAGGDSADIRITNINQDIRQILEISNFNRLFTIE